ncbi:hypothetical protein J5N97_011514 [Dioscorea zingiberensis]|uniref:Endonuclease/exonuclease/phosphatase domain-containing protein n=1 Tax=Dioscorea zingiberensis TaxID=325984 RepID=A0A9D5D2B6_9LILI|nr:hypothetical protein J5N97_011514 [Dioscorea zingiberensis]
MDSIKILCWNCRGSSNPRTTGRIRALMRELSPNIVCLVETRADEGRAKTICKKFSKAWEWAAIPANGMSGGIIIFWKHEMGLVTPLAHSRYVLHLIVSNEKPKEWILSVVYNSQHIQVQKSVWCALAGMSSLNLPWILTGDFNAILSTEEHRGGGFDHYSTKSKYFSEFISANQLFDLGYYGSPYTWCNKQNGLARRWARLDRYLANSSWISCFDSYYNKHLCRTLSDHSPMLLTARFFTSSKKKVFRFENYWFEHALCHQKVYKAWNFKTVTSPLHAFAHLTSRTRSILLDKKTFWHVC